MPIGRLQLRHLLALVALIAAPSLASADPIDLVQNGGFETGNFSGWSVTGPCQFVLSSIGSSCSGVDSDPGPAHGTYAAYLGAAMPTGGSLKQTLATTAGAFYDLSFSLANTTFAPLGGVLPNSISVLWGGTTIFGATNIAAVSGYNTMVFSGLTALAAGTVLQFDTGHSPAYFLLDDVTVKQVPEPATLTLFGIGMATMGTRRWWKQREAQRAAAAARV